MILAEGVRALVFDPDGWAGRDVGDNSQFYRPSTILVLTQCGREQMASVRFGDGRVSHGHFTNCMREITD